MAAPVTPASSIHELVSSALQEDRVHTDATTRAVVPLGARAKARIVAKAHGVLAGVDYAKAAFEQLCPDASLNWSAADGQPVVVGQLVFEAEGLAHGLLGAERTALNFLQQLSGVATLTAVAVKACQGEFQVLDTRKTVPGLRDAQKAAVLAGGGVNHRRDLSEQLLLKENHFALSGRNFGETVALAVQAAAGKQVGAEAQDLDEAQAALRAGAHYVLLDNFSREELRTAVPELRKEFPSAILELSGGLQADTLAEFVGLGIDRVSLGALTHSVPALDLSFLLDAAVS